MAPFSRSPKLLTAVALVAMLHLLSMRTAKGQAYTLPGLSDLPALPGLASGLINSVTSGASWLAGVQVLATIAVDDASCWQPIPYQYLYRSMGPGLIKYCTRYVVPTTAVETHGARRCPV